MNRIVFPNSRVIIEGSTKGIVSAGEKGDLSDNGEITIKARLVDNQKVKKFFHISATIHNGMYEPYDVAVHGSPEDVVNYLNDYPDRDITLIKILDRRYRNKK